MVSTISIKLSKVDLEKLEKQVAITGALNRSDYVRQAIREKLKNDEVPA